MLSRLISKYKNITIKNRLILGASFFSIVFVFNSIVSLLSLSKSNSTLEHIINISNKKTSILNHVKDIVFSIDLDYSTIISTTDEFLIEEKMDLIRNNNAIINVKFQDYTRLPKNPKGEEIVREILDGVNQLLEINTSMDSTIKSGNLGGARILFTRGIHPTSIDLVEKINQLIKIEEKSNQDYSNSATSLNKTVFIILSLFSFLYVILNAYLSFKLIKSIVKPINYAIQFAENISNGNLKQEIRVESQDEAGTLLEYLKNMQNSLRNIVSGIRESSQGSTQTALEFLDVSKQFIQTAEEQFETAENVSMLSENVISRNNSLVQSLKKANDDVNSINGNIEMMNAISSKVNSLITEFVVQSKKSTESAKIGEQKINNSMKSMEEIRNSSKQIQSVVTIITEISNKTNLLALNASIEAARAGESGKGFAVVANEVSSLATSTALSIKQIKELVFTSNENINKGVKEVSDISILLKNIIDSINNLGKTSNLLLDDIRQQSKKSEVVHKSTLELMKFLKNIDQIINEQMVTSKEVGVKIGNLKTNSYTIKTGSVQIEDKAKGLTIQAELIKQSAQKFII